MWSQPDKHYSRYITHDLGLGVCQGDDRACKNACKTPAAAVGRTIEATVTESTVAAEYQLMSRIEKEGVETTEYLCGGMELKGTDGWRPEHNPFWVVRTTEAVMQNHGDIFNPNFVAFLRQMYLSFIFARFRVQTN